AVRTRALRSFHHRGDVRTAGVPSWRCERRDPKAFAFARAVSRARALGWRLLAGQGAARDRAITPSRLRRADLSARRDGENHQLLYRARHSAWRIAARARRDQSKSRRYHHALSAGGFE